MMLKMSSQGIYFSSEVLEETSIYRNKIHHVLNNSECEISHQNMMQGGLQNVCDGCCNS